MLTCVLQDDDIEVRKIKHLGLIKTKVAKVVYPDKVFVKEEEFVETETLPISKGIHYNS